MGYDIVAMQEFCQQYAAEFPVREGLVYLNHAAVAPLCRRAADAMKALVDDAAYHGSYHYDVWLQAYEGVRIATAKLINAHRDEIATVKNTSEGIATVALGFPWKPGDRVVAFREEFPANYYIWKKLEEKGVAVTWLSFLDPLERVEEACQGAQMLSISFVQYLSGFRADIEKIGDICHRAGVFFLVDAIQGLGAIPLDVERMHVDALTADGHKWLLGPEGCGVLYVRKAWQDRIEPVEFGWTNVAGFTDYSSRDMALRTDAGRYECGTLNTVGCFGLRASMELLLDVGVERIGPQVIALADQIEREARARGYEILGERTPDNAAGIICIRKPGMDSRMVHAALKEHKVLTAPRQGWVRLSPHFYITPADITRAMDGLPV